MSEGQPAGGIGQLLKSATPLIGRVGAVASGIIGLLVALEKVSGQLITTVEGFLLVVAVVASGVVVWGHSTQVVAGRSASVPFYSRRQRMIAAIVLAAASVLMVLFMIRLGGDFLLTQGRDVLGGGRPAPRPPQATRQVARETGRAASPAPPIQTMTPAAAFATAAPQPTVTSVLTPGGGLLDDLGVLNRAGFDALATKDYTEALTLFQRVLQVDATNAQGQLGLGTAYYYLGRYRPAVIPLQAALQLDSTLVDAHAYLGLSYEQLGDNVRAMAEYEEYLRVAPKDAAMRPTIVDALKRVSALTIPASTPVPTP